MGKTSKNQRKAAVAEYRKADRKAAKADRKAEADRKAALRDKKLYRVPFHPNYTNQFGDYKLPSFEKLQALRDRAEDYDRFDEDQKIALDFLLKINK